jgi:hypothetical protein
MTEAFAAVNGHRLTRLRLVTENVGPWHADVTFEVAPELADGPVTLAVGTRTWKGTLTSQTFGLQRKGRIVAGAGGWGTAVKAKGYHNDAGVKARSVADDAAREVGEQIGSFVPAKERVGADYVREARAASCALEDVLGGVAWWVDADGVTHAGPRASVALSSADYEVLAFDPESLVATLAVDDPGAVQIGSIISERLDGPQTVRQLELTVDATEMRIAAWCGGGEAERGRLPGLMRAIIDRATDGRLWGKYRYRVLRMNGERVELQAVRKELGLPDVLPVSMWPGVAGVHAELAPSQEVLVEFLEGRRAQPIVTAFAGKDGSGFVPVSITLGGTSGPEVTRKGDAVEVLLPPMVANGTMVVGGTPTPFTAVLTSTLGKAVGVATAGTPKVRAAS